MMVSVREACLNALQLHADDRASQTRVWAAAIERGVSYGELSKLLDIPKLTLYERLRRHVVVPPLDREMA